MPDIIGLVRLRAAVLMDDIVTRTVVVIKKSRIDFESLLPHSAQGNQVLSPSRPIFLELEYHRALILMIYFCSAFLVFV